MFIEQDMHLWELWSESELSSLMIPCLIADFRKEWKQEQDMWNPYGGIHCGKETAGPSEEAIMACAKADLEFEIATMFWEIV